MCIARHSSFCKVFAIISKLIAKNFGETKKVCTFAHRFGNRSQMVDVAQLVRVEDCGS